MAPKKKNYNTRKNNKTDNKLNENNDIDNIDNDDCSDDDTNSDEKDFYEYIDNRMKQTESTIINFIEMNMRLVNTRLDDTIKDVAAVKESLNFQDDINGKKLKNIEDRIAQLEQDLQQFNGKPTNHIQPDINEIFEKMRDIEDRARRNNLRFEGIRDDLKEDWAESEKKIKIVIQNNLGLDADNIIIERAHRIGKKNDKKDRIIVARFLNYKDREVILKSRFKLKETGIYINEDYSDETIKIRNDLMPQVKRYRSEGKFAFLQYDRIVVRDWKPKVNT